MNISFIDLEIAYDTNLREMTMGYLGGWWSQRRGSGWWKLHMKTRGAECYLDRKCQEGSK